MVVQIVTDYYRGFEGEPEITFVREAAGGEPVGFRMWDGYFNAFMDAIPAGPEGWTGLALPYHLYTGWYDGPWKIPDLPAAIHQLEAIDRTRIRSEGRDKALEILDHLIQFLNQAVVKGEDVSILYG